MEWSGHQIFAEAPMLPFVVDDEEAGLLKSYGPLSFLKVSYTINMFLHSLCFLLYIFNWLL